MKSLNISKKKGTKYLNERVERMRNNLDIHGAFYRPYQFKLGPDEILRPNLQKVSNQVHLHPFQQLLDFRETLIASGLV